MMNTVPFEKWADVLEAARRGKPLYYKAPLDPRPIRLTPSEGDKTRVPYTYEVKSRTIKIWPPGSVGRGSQRYSDPFTADSGHLDRFSHESGAAEVEAPRASRARRQAGGGHIPHNRLMSIADDLARRLQGTAPKSVIVGGGPGARFTTYSPGCQLVV